MLQREAPARQRPHDVVEDAGRYDDPPSSSTSAGDDVWTEISMSVADSLTTPSPASRSIPPSNWMVDLAETPRETSASFLPKVSVLQTALIPPPFSPYYYYLTLYLLDY